MGDGASYSLLSTANVLRWGGGRLLSYPLDCIMRFA